MRLSSTQMALMSRLLDEALPLDASARRRWLDELPAAYDELADALRNALLPEETSTRDPLHTLPKFDAAPTKVTGEHSGLAPGALVGPYRLVRLLGAGGMAEVWLAERADGAFTREVALKLPMLTRLRQDVEQRFGVERDILASLEHPNIARLYDAGVDPRGLPYLAMEYVQGAPLTEWCDARRLAVRGRIELFLQVLEAVNYAHDKRVVHRDLKPSNILVTESGQIRLLDFGVAKLLADAQIALPAALNRIRGRALTPAYASPELVRSETVDARSDVYSLGVLLHEILTGVRPYDVPAGASLQELERLIAAVDLQRPSTRVDPATAATHGSTPDQLRRTLRGDLDAVILKALELHPDDRYGSVADMAHDLQCHLHSQPVAAHSAGMGYRLGKFLERHRAEALISLVAVVAVAATAVYQHRIVTAAHPPTLLRAAPSAVKSIAVLPFDDLSEHHDQEYFADGLAEEILRRLALTPGLEVTARTSAFSFKGRKVDIASIAQKLKVAHVLEGSVAKSNGRLRVSAQLVRADGGVLWSESFDRRLSDVFNMQDEIADAVVHVLKLKLTPAALPAVHGTKDAAAYNEYLLGRQLLNRANDPVGYRRASEAFHRAIAADAAYAAPYAGLVYTEAIIADQTGEAAGLRQAQAYADKAVALAPSQADGYAARGYLRFLWLWDWPGARADFEKALAIDGRDATVRRHYGQLMGCLGRLPEAIAAARQSTELDPLADASWLLLGRYLMADGQFTNAHRALARALEIQPEDSYVLHDLGTLQLLEGDANGAAATFQLARSDGVRLMGLAMAEHSRGHGKAAQQALDALVSGYGQAWAYQIAEVYAWRGEREPAFDWLQLGYERHDGGLSNLKVDALLAGLRDDPRFGAMLRKLKLPES